MQFVQNWVPLGFVIRDGSPGTIFTSVLPYKTEIRLYNITFLQKMTNVVKNCIKNIVEKNKSSTCRKGRVVKRKLTLIV